MMIEASDPERNSPHIEVQVCFGFGAVQRLCQEFFWTPAVSWDDQGLVTFQYIFLHARLRQLFLECL
jgi:hypothetical protein